MRKNLTKQYSKRPWRTPSPSSPNDLRSPNYLRGNFHRIQGNRVQKVDGNSENKSKPTVLNFRNHIMELKQQTNKLSNLQINKNKHLANEYLTKNQQKPSSNEIDSYNSYFNKASSAYSTIMNNHGKGMKNRNNGLKTQSNSQLGRIVFNYSQNQSHSAQKQSIKRMTQQNLKLRKSLKEIQDNYDKIIEQNKKLSQELKQQKSKKSQIKSKQLQRENQLQKEIKNLREQIEITNEDLKNSNLQIYKMKQELFQYQIHSQKVSNESKDKIQEKNSEKPKTNHKLSLIPSTHSQISSNQVHKQIQQCLSCKISQKIIINLNNAIQNKMLEVNRKDLTIQSLFSDLQKVEQQSKMFEKPKLIFKKMSLAMDAVNQSAILVGLKSLNSKMGRNLC